MSLNVDTACSEAEALSRYLADTTDHELTIVRDDGLYRHLLVKKPGTGMYWFEVVTWPGTLTVNGDMGTFTFRRVDDMFRFFRSEPHGRINASYWAEKLVGSEPGRAGAKAYSEDAYRQHVEEAVADWIEDRWENEAQATSLRAAVYEALLDRDAIDYPGNYHESAREAIGSFEHRMVAHDKKYDYFSARVLDHGAPDETFRFHDTWEWDLTGYDLFFLWNAYALRDAIHRYDRAKADARPQPKRAVRAGSAA